MLASVHGNAEEKAKALDIDLAGYRNAEKGEFRGVGEFAYFWATPENTPNSDEANKVPFVYIARGRLGGLVSSDLFDPAHGLPIRFLWNK